jgi:hypothetical protein
VSSKSEIESARAHESESESERGRERGRARANFTSFYLPWDRGEAAGTAWQALKASLGRSSLGET